MDQIPGQYHDGIITVVAQNSSFIGEVSFHIDYEKDIVEYYRAIIPAIFECLLILQNYVITLRVFNEEKLLIFINLEVKKLMNRENMLLHV